MINAVVVWCCYIQNCGFPPAKSRSVALNHQAKTKHHSRRYLPTKKTVPTSKSVQISEIYILLYIYILILHCALLQNNLFFGNKLCFLIFLNFAASFPNLCLPAQLPNNSPCVFPLPQLLAWWAATAELQRKDHPCDYRWDLSTASHAMPWDTL